MATGTLEDVHDVEFDETEGSQNEAQNLDDVRGYQLENAMKNMDVGDIRPRQVDENGDIHMINQEVQINANEANTSGSHGDDQNQASGSNQLPILQSISIARDHPLDQVIGGIQSGVQTRS